jgi:MinD-like ATPase involved in chromosome partitioning or flagellar assembly
MRFRYGKPPRVYYWVKYLVSGRYGILGPYNTEAEANEKAIEELRGAIKFEVIPLDTRNKSAASGKLKAVILKDTHDISQAMQRIQHKVPEEQGVETIRYL